MNAKSQKPDRLKQKEYQAESASNKVMRLHKSASLS